MRYQALKEDTLREAIMLNQMGLSWAKTAYFMRISQGRLYYQCAALLREDAKNAT